MFEDWSHEIAKKDGLSNLNIVTSDGKTKLFGMEILVRKRDITSPT